MFHAISWSSNNAGRSIKSSTSEEVLAAAFGSDEAKPIDNVYTELLGTPVGIIIVVESMDLFNTISASHLPAHRSIRGDVATLRYDFETG